MTSKRMTKAALGGFSRLASAAALAVFLANVGPGVVGNLACAQEAAATGGDDQELANLLNVLAEETAVATKTRMNGDFVPGIVTVLQGDELEALGFETAGQALALVPGIQAVRDRNGLPSVIVRGLDFPFNSGNVKVLIDGVSLSREAAGINGIALQIPIAQVERVEVMRGPGSVVYGDFAFMGLVNIVTRRDGRRAYARLGDEALSGGGRLSVKTADGWALSAAISGLTSGDARVAAPREADEERAFGTLSVARGGFRLTAHAMARDVDDARPGIGAVTGSQTHWAVEARYAREMASSLKAELTASYLHNRYEIEFANFRGDVAGTALDVTWDGWRGQSWLMQVSFSAGRIDEATAQTPPAPPPAPPSPLLVIRDKNRDTTSVTLQDRFDITEALALTAGARLDHVSDVGTRVTPRVSLAFRPAEEHVVKLQYAEGFRAPTFFELYGPGFRVPNLTFEVNATAELNYVYRRPSSVVRATLFHSTIRDMIYGGRLGQFDNDHKGKAYGFEAEWEGQVGPRLKLQANLSWVRALENRNPARVEQRVGASADWLWSVAALYRPWSKTLLTLRYSHVGDRNTASDPKGFDLVDLTATRNDVLVQGLQLRAGIKNIFKSEPRYTFTTPFGTEYASFPGRAAFVQLSYTR